MIYADYDYYLETYLGTLSEDSFNSLIIKASKEIDKNINTRLTETKINNLPEEAQEQLKYTACALVDLIYQKQENDNKSTNSISIDGVSKTFNKVAESDYNTKTQKIIECLPIELTRYL